MCKNSSPVAASREDIYKKCREAFKLTLEALAKKERQVKATEKNLHFLQGQLSGINQKLVAAEEEIEHLKCTETFYADGRYMNSISY